MIEQREREIEQREREIEETDRRNQRLAQMIAALLAATTPREREQLAARGLLGDSAGAS